MAGPTLLAATNRRTATALLWETLAASCPERPVEIGTSAPPTSGPSTSDWPPRLSVFTSGYLAVRGMRPPAAYLPDGQFL